MSHEIFGARGGQMYREGWKHKEIRVAIDSPSGAYDDPEQAGDSKPEKAHGQGRQQPAEVRSRAEYYEKLRATDKQMAASDGHSDRPPPDSLHNLPKRRVGRRTRCSPRFRRPPGGPGCGVRSPRSSPRSARSGPPTGPWRRCWSSRSASARRSRQAARPTSPTTRPTRPGSTPPRARWPRSSRSAS